MPVWVVLPPSVLCGFLVVAAAAAAAEVRALWPLPLFAVVHLAVAVVQIVVVVVRVGQVWPVVNRLMASALPVAAAAAAAVVVVYSSVAGCSNTPRAAV